MSTSGRGEPTPTPADPSATEPCFSCGAVVPVTEGPTHAYMLSSAGCWAMYGEVLAREYQDVTFAAHHRFTVDAYAVQHPGEPTAAAKRSVLYHLISLCAVLEHDLGLSEATALLQRLGARTREVRWLEPPGSLGEVTVADVHRADGAAAHLAAVERWARSAWEAWAPHHLFLRERVDGLL